MTKKIFRAVFLGAMAVLLASLVIILGALYHYFADLQRVELQQMLAMAAEGTEQQGTAYLSALSLEDCRLTLVDENGTVHFDSQVAPETMENHAGREEIREALQTGSGESTRYSSTLTEQTVYLARRLSDGTVLRISAGRATVLYLMLGSFQPILMVIVVALVLSLLLAKWMSRRIVEPLNCLNLEHPLENDSYDELSPLLTRIDALHRQVSQQVEALKQKNDEFSQITGNMHEGLVLLNAHEQVVSINPAARQLWNAAADCVGKDFSTVDHSHELWEQIRLAGRQGQASLRLSRQERIYQLDLSRIDVEGRQTGLVLLAVDITERASAEERRREFTANVSHELKTPLQSIMGSAELLENNLVKPEDTPRFIGRIRSEAARMLALIEDIIRLSQLDEEAEITQEPLELYALAQREVEELRPLAASRQVSLKLAGGPATVTGSAQLVHEILYNLCENAIKYNVEGGSVTVQMEHTGEWVRLCVSDTGIGIPPEHQDRVFERFYRVDKSRSKATGGTGLGLSIVKHAARDMGGVIDLKSTPGQGTAVTITFPAKRD